MNLGQRAISLVIATVLVLACAVPAAASGNSVTVTDDGLYVTDDGLYGIRISADNPGAVDLVRYLPDKAPENLVVPAYVLLNGGRIPVNALDYYTYRNHTEIETVTLEDGIRILNGDPFLGCTGIQKITYASGISHIYSSVFYYLDQFVEIEELNGNNVGVASDYVDVQITPHSLTGSHDKSITVTFTLKDGVDTFPFCLYTQLSVLYESMEPIDDPDTTVAEGNILVRLGYDPETGTNHDRSRTYTFQIPKEGQGSKFEIVGSVPQKAANGRTEWTAVGTTTYIVPNNPDAASPDGRYKPIVFTDFLPIPAEVAPIQMEALNATNMLRAEVGAEALELNEFLCQAAMVRATEMALADELSHTRPNNTSWNTVITNFSSKMGENILYNFNPSTENLGNASVAQWRDSAGHYANMISKDFNTMGVGFARSEKTGRWYACQLFGYVQPAYLKAVTIDEVQLREPYFPPSVSNTVDKSSLEAAVQSAKARLAGLVPSEDGTDVLPSQSWIWPSEIEIVEREISYAESALKNAWATQADVDSALASLQGYVKHLEAYMHPSLQEKSALRPEIEAARILYDETVQSTDGTDILPSQQWATSKARIDVSIAINRAEDAIKNVKMTQSDWDAMQTYFRKAVETLNTERRPGTLNKSALQTATEKANKLKDATVSSTNGKDVPASQNWVTYETRNALLGAIAKAEYTLNTDRVAQSVVDADLAALQTAMQSVETELQPGLQTDVSAEPTVTAKPTATATPTASSKPNVTTTPTASSRPTVTASPTATTRPTMTSKPTATVRPMPSAAASSDTTAGPDPAASAAPPAVTGYQTGIIKGAPIHVKISGSSTMFYIRNASGKMERVAVPYERTEDNVRYYPINNGGAALFPKLNGGAVASYVSWSDGQEKTVLRQETKIPRNDGSYQEGKLNGTTYFVKVSGSSVMYYIRTPFGKLERVAVPYVTGANRVRFYPVNHGGTILFPKLRDGILNSYTSMQSGVEVSVLVAS